MLNYSEKFFRCFLITVIALSVLGFELCAQTVIGTDLTVLQAVISTGQLTVNNAASLSSLNITGSALVGTDLMISNSVTIANGLILSGSAYCFTPTSTFLRGIKGVKSVGSVSANTNFSPFNIQFNTNTASHTVIKYTMMGIATSGIYSGDVFTIDGSVILTRNSGSSNMSAVDIGTPVTVYSWGGSGPALTNQNSNGYISGTNTASYNYRLDTAASNVVIFYEATGGAMTVT